jgi:CxxC motif-containing protein (DUF1111 family)
MVACDTLFTAVPDDADAMDASLPGLTPAELATFSRGDGEFERSFAPTEGLGPIFNNVACGACHSGDGRGRPENILVRLGEPPDMAMAVGGPQLQDKAIDRAVPEVLPPSVPASRRLPPPVFGVGLIEGIPEGDILANADPNDRDGDGISGRPNWVRPPSFVPESEPGGGPGFQLGRFSRKAQVSTLLQQTVEAYHQDMGITSDFIPEENINPQSGAGTDAADLVADPEVPLSTVRAVVSYIRMLAPPEPGEDTPERTRGRELFDQVQCSACHIPQFQTGPNNIGALTNKSVELFSDLLLHDMGDELADNRVDGSATGREWRTAPLWGLRVMRNFLNGDAFLLHDGRAHTILDAILLHGGEAEGSVDLFEGLSADDQEALLEFVRSR